MSLSILVLLVLPILSTIAYKHEHTKHILKTSWMSIHLAVLLSSGGGLMLEKYEHKHHSITFYIPLIDGIGKYRPCTMYNMQKLLQQACNTLTHLFI